MEFVEKIKQKAKSNLKTIVLPEAEEERNLKAADRILSEGFAKLILIGNPEKVHHLASELYLENIAGAEIVDPNDNPKKQQYVDLMLKLRASKGLTAEQAEKLIVNPLYLGALMVKAGDADGEVAGANNPTGDVLRPAFQYVKTLPGISVVSGGFHHHASGYDVRRERHDGFRRLRRASESDGRGTGSDRRDDRAHDPRDCRVRASHRDAELFDERIGQARNGRQSGPR